MRAGEIRIRALRVVQYSSIVIAVSSVATAIKLDAIPLWLLLLCVPVVIVAVFVDPKMVGGENSYFNRNNAELQQLIADVRRIREHLEGK